jgi:hypothetical protein
MNEHLSDEQLIQQVTTALNAEADAAFPDERLNRQRARILQRLDLKSRPGRLIAFPAGAHHTPALLMHTSPTTRWVAAAAAVAFVAGVVAGQRLPPGFHFQSGTPLAISRPAGPQATGTTLRASAELVPSDDEFLGEVEMAAQSRPAILRHLDALTPRAWDVESADRASQ